MANPLTTTAAPLLTANDATRRLRLERLIGTDDTRGVRGDLARARAAKAAGYTTFVGGLTVDAAIASYEAALETYRARLAEVAS